MWSCQSNVYRSSPVSYLVILWLLCLHFIEVFIKLIHFKNVLNFETHWKKSKHFETETDAVPLGWLNASQITGISVTSKFPCFHEKDSAKPFPGSKLKISWPDLRCNCVGANSLQTNVVSKTGTFWLGERMPTGNRGPGKK